MKSSRSQTTSRVFIVQRPTSRDAMTGAVVPSMDLSPALEWGQPIYILRDSENPFNDINATAAEIDRVFDREKFGDDDWLLLVGNPILIGVVAAIASGYTDRLNMLQWSRAKRIYMPVRVDLPELTIQDVFLGEH